MNTLHWIHSKRLKNLLILFFFLISASIWLGIWLRSHYYVSTDDAYINANIVQIAPRVTGKVNRLYIRNNQYVKKGQLLFTLDAEPFQIAVASAKAQVAMNEAELIKATHTGSRTLSLVHKKYLSIQDGDNATALVKTAQGALDYAKAGLAQALLNLKYTQIIAPANGWITNASLREGEIVSVNQPLFALINDAEFWVDANFKETEMGAIKPGQPAIVRTDLYTKHPFKAVVESISGGTGNAFSLLPPQNATGNWVKVTQRVPIRLHILNPDPMHPLRVGISAEVTIKLQNDLQKS